MHNNEFSLNIFIHQENRKQQKETNLIK